MIRWSDALADYQRDGRAHVLVSVIATEGSVPRNAGSKMLVACDQAIDTIGGGNLELHAIEFSRQLLAQGKACQRIEKIPLAAAMGQCCGGHATLLFECFVNTSTQVWLFGAGHVGKALSLILSELPVHLHWVDTREEFLPKQDAPNCTPYAVQDTTDVFQRIPKQALILIMTHCHAQDYDICAAALAQQHEGFIGLIGSKTKAARFRHRLQRAGFSSEQIQGIECPIGIKGTGGKRPMEVAVSIAGRLIEVYSTQATSFIDTGDLHQLTDTINETLHDTQ
ncbi:xanthine dehydrogenase accessory protein XdhC [Nitrincola tibetensis]|uniref:Xanthine dehydrogenase accessory protein XdhC n=1 Tax=Nitrincola tibetensis TaxID=2219697 RepID=A0A364NPQ3_9GAMM|nr:xanthine dehydrogenase accessory protein XdhC [Nitrincola tibetensis]RAU18865.1 xanthine dehydrogenase accessory protein XdhC [Nitrincola tibetensis]